MKRASGAADGAVEGAGPIDETDLAAVAPMIDLEAVPLSYPGSRLVIRRSSDGVEICVATYEVPLDETCIVRCLTIVDSTGDPCLISDVRPDRVQFGGGGATLTFAGPHAVSVGGAPGLFVTFVGANGVPRTEPLGDTSIVIGVDGPVEHASIEDHERALEGSRKIWGEWMAKCPVVRTDLTSMALLCWYVLGANTVDLNLRGLRRRAVVPSMIGYVGLWQWDAYFIAIGLRHGDLDLAREQLDIALEFVGDDGQLPDVVHDDGVLMSSADLPASDLVALQKHCPSALIDGQVVPLTKPPLTAWAISKVFATACRDATDPNGGVDPFDWQSWRQRVNAVAAASQDWWFRSSDVDRDGLPEYAHPYSSGLDDSPVFDGGVPVATPDLASYLVMQDRLLARQATSGADTDLHQRRADATGARLLELWDADRGYFAARRDGQRVAVDAVIGLLPLLTAALPTPITEALVAAIADQQRYGTPWPLPTVAVNDANFSADRMWRGPTWINTNYLVIEGLIRSGHLAEAERLAESTLALVIHGGGPHEYFDPLTGQRAATATTAFAWSAALFIDLAVRVSSGEYAETDV